jgi:IS5 family transposase
MLRIHLLQHWFNLEDNAVEEALYRLFATEAVRGVVAPSQHDPVKVRRMRSG